MLMGPAQAGSGSDAIGISMVPTDDVALWIKIKGCGLALVISLNSIRATAYHCHPQGAPS